MKKAFYLIVVVILSCTTGSAQNALAKLKYEEAEEAFAKPDSKKTLEKLEEVEQLLGSVNPKIMFLRIMAQVRLLIDGDFAFLQQTRKNVQFYLKNYGDIEGLEEKFKEVYSVSKTLEKYPTTKEGFDKEVASITEFMDSVARVYGGSRHTTEAEFKARYASSVRTMTRDVVDDTKVAYKREGWPVSNTFEQGPYHVLFKGGKLASMDYYILSNTSDKSAGINYYNKLKRQITARFPEYRVDVNEKYNYFSLYTSKPSLTKYVSFTYNSYDNVVEVKFLN